MDKERARFFFVLFGINVFVKILIQRDNCDVSNKNVFCTLWPFVKVTEIQTAFVFNSVIRSLISAALFFIISCCESRAACILSNINQ